MYRVELGYNKLAGTNDGVGGNYNIDNSIFTKLSNSCKALMKKKDDIENRQGEIFSTLSGIQAKDLPTLHDIAFGSYNDTAGGSKYSIDTVMSDGIDFYGPILDYLDDAYSDISIWQFLERVMSKNGFVMHSYPYCKAGFSIAWANIRNDENGFEPTAIKGKEDVSSDSDALGELSGSIGYMKERGEVRVRNRDSDYLVEDMSFSMSESGNIVSSNALDSIAKRESDTTSSANVSLLELWNSVSYKAAFTVVNEPLWKPGDTVNITNAGVWSGKYYILTVDISLESSRIKTAVEAQRLPTK